VKGNQFFGSKARNMRTLHRRFEQTYLDIINHYKWVKQKGFYVCAQWSYSTLDPFWTISRGFRSQL